MDRSAVGGSGLAARSTHLDDKGLPGMDEGPSLANRPGGIFLLDAIALVGRGQAKFLGSIERLAKLHRHASGLDQMQAESGSQPIVRPGDFRSDQAVEAAKAARAASNIA
jgi:hypothetical protein